MIDFVSGCYAIRTIVDIDGPLRYVTPFSGRLVGWGLELLFFLVYVNAVWFLIKHNATAVSRRIVILVYVLAGLEWYRLWYLVYWTGRGPTKGAAAENVYAIYVGQSLFLFLWGACLIAALALLSALQKNPRHTTSSFQGMFGAIAGLVAVVLPQLGFLCFFYFATLKNEKRNYSDLWQRLHQTEQRAVPAATEAAPAER